MTIEKKPASAVSTALSNATPQDVALSDAKLESVAGGGGFVDAALNAAIRHSGRKAARIKIQRQPI